MLLIVYFTADDLVTNGSISLLGEIFGDLQFQVRSPCGYVKEPCDGLYYISRRKNRLENDAVAKESLSRLRNSLFVMNRECETRVGNVCDPRAGSHS